MLLGVMPASAEFSALKPGSYAVGQVLKEVVELATIWLTEGYCTICSRSQATSRSRHSASSWGCARQRRSRFSGTTSMPKIVNIRSSCRRCNCVRIVLWVLCVDVGSRDKHSGRTPLLPGDPGHCVLVPLHQTPSLLSPGTSWK